MMLMDGDCSTGFSGVDSFEYLGLLPELDLEQTAVLEVHGIQVDVVADLELVAQFVLLLQRLLRLWEAVAQVLVYQIDKVALPLSALLLQSRVRDSCGACPEK